MFKPTPLVEILEVGWETTPIYYRRTLINMEGLSIKEYISLSLGGCNDDY